MEPTCIATYYIDTYSKSHNNIVLSHNNTCGQHQRESLWFIWLIPCTVCLLHDGINAKPLSNWCVPSSIHQLLFCQLDKYYSPAH